MNKYQEALNELCEYAMESNYDYDWNDNLILDYDKLNENDLNRLKGPLQELVEKATPKKPIQLRDKNRNKCPNCENQLPFKKNAIKKHMPRLYCDRCGQRIDWSEDDESTK